MESAEHDPLQARTQDGDRPLDGHVEALYETLRRIAQRTIRGRAGQSSIDPTELVHECYLKLMKSAQSGSLPRTELLALAATAIRTVLLDHARERAALKRGGGQTRVTLHAESLVQRESVDLIELDSALARLAELDPRMSRVVELRFFANLSIEDVATTLGTSRRKVEQDWSMAKAWLHRELAP